MGRGGPGNVRGLRALGRKEHGHGYVAAEHARDGEGFEIQIFEHTRPARIHMTPLFDANGGRQRG